MSVASYYDKLAKDYHKQYDGTSEDYPANAIRLKHIISRLKSLKAKSVFEIGVGEGTPLKQIRDELGIEVSGCDVSPEMVKLASEKLPNVITRLDIEEAEITVSSIDAVIASGVLPHVRNENNLMMNIHGLLKQGGSAIVEFRNSLFSLFSFNRHTISFFMDELLAGVSEPVRDSMYWFLVGRVYSDSPSKSEFDKISRFHNPFVLQDMFTTHGFQTTGFIWYHAHPAPPLLESAIGEDFRQEALKLEKGNDWRGMFMCSAGLIEVKKQ